MPARRLLLRLAFAAAAWPALRRSQAAEAGAVVEIRDYKFVPETLTVKAGTTVRWINQEKRTTHSVLFTGAGGFESERMFPGESWERRFDQPGTHPYTCGPHPEMKGRIHVTE